MNDQVLVIGGGIAGVQAALDMADAGVRVVLVERSPAIGGKMAALDKNFPTLDCSICIEAPKLSEVEQHPNLDMNAHADGTVKPPDGWPQIPANRLHLRRSFFALSNFQLPVLRGHQQHSPYRQHNSQSLSGCDWII